MEDYQDIVDETEDDFEQMQDLQDSQLDAYGTGISPEIKEQQNLYNWFWKVVRLNEPFRSVKVANLSYKEIGECPVSVRDAMNLAHLGRIFGHPNFGAYFDTSAKITSATSMAKKGWFMDLSISQKKVRERARKPVSTDGEKSWRIFKKKQNTTTQ